jgi:hypothetical protein
VEGAKTLASGRLFIGTSIFKSQENGFIHKSLKSTTKRGAVKKRQKK